jgi:hypothetical protein
MPSPTWADAIRALICGFRRRIRVSERDRSPWESSLPGRDRQCQNKVKGDTLEGMNQPLHQAISTVG